ncbi:hypothetical protein KIL84_011185, partial [Mauremys mutica]
MCFLPSSHTSYYWTTRNKVESCLFWYPWVLGIPSPEGEVEHGAPGTPQESGKIGSGLLVFPDEVEMEENDAVWGSQNCLATVQCCKHEAITPPKSGLLPRERPK